MQRLGHRHVLILTEADDWLDAIIATIHEQYSNTLLISNKTSHTSLFKTSHTTLKPLLSQHFQVVMIDCSKGFIANDIYAAAGLIERGGLLVLNTPSKEKWPGYYAKHMGIKYSFADNHQHSYFATILTYAFEQSDAAAWWSPSYFILPPDAKQKTPVNAEQPYKSTTTADTPALSKGQQRIRTQIIKRWEEDESLQVIGAKRGRGKTTLLATLAVDAYLAGWKNVMVCAPSKSQSAAFFKYYKALQGQQAIDKLPQFIPPDQYTKAAKADILLVDEMASISPLLLDKISVHARHIVLAGTIDGYEGSGQGLVLKWLPKQQQVSQYFTLTAPFRWLADDPLETLVDQFLCPTLTKHSISSSRPFSLIRVDKTELVNNQQLYAKCFGLLIDAHYQSNANDIQRMLDATDHTIWIYRNDLDEIAGVICTIREGGSQTFESSELRQSISKGLRRVQGHMSSQALAQGLNDASICLLRLCRIHRIAIHADAQRTGLGSTMLQALHTHLAPLGIDGFTTSFGMTNELHAFWCKNGYVLIKLGHRVDTSSGTITGHYIHRDSHQFNAIRDRGNAALAIDIRYFSAYQPEVFALVPESIKHNVSATASAAQKSFVLQKCQDFVCGNSSFAMIKSSAFALARTIKSEELLELIERLHRPHLSSVQKSENIALIKQFLSKVVAD
jgi:tRNA(Met) cytidine acetyltransferase